MFTKTLRKILAQTFCNFSQRAHVYANTWPGATCAGMDAPNQNAPYNNTTGNAAPPIHPHNRPKTRFGDMHAHNGQKRPYAAPCGVCRPERRNDPPLGAGVAGSVSYPGGIKRIKTCRGTASLVTRRLPHVLIIVPAHFAVPHLHSKVARARTPRHQHLERPRRPKILPPSRGPRFSYTGPSGWGSNKTLDCCSPAFPGSPGVPPSGRTYSS